MTAPSTPDPRLVLSGNRTFVWTGRMKMGGVPPTYMPAMWWKEMGDEWRPGMAYTPQSLFSRGSYLSRESFLGRPADLQNDEDETAYRAFCLQHDIPLAKVK